MNKNVKNIPNIISCNLQKDDQILIVFGTSIPDTAGHQMSVHIPTSPKVCFCTTCKKKQNKRIMHWS